MTPYILQWQQTCSSWFAEAYYTIISDAEHITPSKGEGENIFLRHPE